VAYRREGSTYRIFLEKAEGKRQLGTLRRIKDDNIKMFLQDIS